MDFQISRRIILPYLLNPASASSQESRLWQECGIWAIFITFGETLPQCSLSLSLFFFFFFCESCLDYIYNFHFSWSLQINYTCQCAQSYPVSHVFKNVIISLMDLWNSQWGLLVTTSTHRFPYSCGKYLLPIFYVPSWVLGTGYMLMNKTVIWKPFLKGWIPK